MCYFSFYFIFICKNCIIILGVIMKNIRLEKVLSFIHQTDCLADVGCDHGYLAIMAIEKGVSFVQLIDNKKGPLDSAKINLKHYQKMATVEYSLSSGISNILPIINTVAICGMGGELISQILLNDIEKAKNVKKIILQPNSKISLLRKFLYDNDFDITNETIVMDNDKIYEIIVASPSDGKVNFNKLDIIFGPHLRTKKDPLFISKWVKKYEYNLEIMENIDNNSLKFEELLEENNYIKEVLYEN